jgi:hypothetical protein
MKKTTRNRLLWLASILSRRATAIRRYVKARTPPRKPRAQRDGSAMNPTTLLQFGKEADRVINGKP